MVNTCLHQVFHALFCAFVVGIGNFRRRPLYSLFGYMKYYKDSEGPCLAAVKKQMRKTEDQEAKEAKEAK